MGDRLRLVGLGWHRSTIRDAATRLMGRIRSMLDSSCFLAGFALAAPGVSVIAASKQQTLWGVYELPAQNTRQQAGPGLRANRLPKASLVHRWLSCTRRLMRSYPFCVTLPPAVKWAPRNWMRASRCSRIFVWCTVSRSPLPSAAPSLRFTQNREVLCVG